MLLWEQRWVNVNSLRCNACSTRAHEYWFILPVSTPVSTPEHLIHTRSLKPLHSVHSHGQVFQEQWTGTLQFHQTWGWRVELSTIGDCGKVVLELRLNECLRIYGIQWIMTKSNKRTNTRGNAHQVTDTFIAVEIKVHFSLLPLFE